MATAQQEYITLKQFDGTEVSGFKIAHPRELPKSATLDRYTYDEQYNSYSIYCAHLKKGTKYYIRKQDN